MVEQKQNNTNTTAATRFAGAALAAIMVLSGTTIAFADSDSRKVVVTRFAGPEESADQLRKAVLEIIEDVYEVVPYRKYRVAQRRAAENSKSKKKSYAKVAKKLGADVIVEGAIKDRRLTLRVRAGKTGSVIDKVRVNISRNNTLSEDSIDLLTDELADLIDYAEPVDSGVPADDFASDRSGNGANADLISASVPSGALAVDERSWDVEESSDDDEENARPSPVQFSGEVGVSGTQRSLLFVQNVQEGGERAAEMAGSPQLGAAFSGTARVDSLGVFTKAHYERSVGGKSAVGQGAGTKQFGTVYSHWGIGAYVDRKVRKRITVRGGVGYHQLSFRLQNDKPMGLRIPDSRYSYADLSGGARIGLRDDRIALTAEAGFMHVIATGGISDNKAYGATTGRGLRGEAGIEFESGANSFIRVAVNFSQLFLTFNNGDGELANGLDADTAVDVSGARDTYLSGKATMGFNF